jgi:ABC-type oligopeptide transport system ATPase subunit
MLGNQNHEKRQTIPDTGHGTKYQIHFSMFYAFYCAYQLNLNFTLYTEDTAYGDFDDLVIITQRGTSAFQFKHRKSIEASPLPINDFLTGSGNGKELMFYKYFDSLYNKIKRGEYPHTAFKLVTNHTLPTELIECLNTQQTQFSEGFFQGSTARLRIIKAFIIASIEKHASKVTSSTTIPSIAQIATFLLDLCQVPEYLTGELKKRLFDDFIRVHLDLRGCESSEEEKERITLSVLNQLASPQNNFERLLEDLLGVLSRREALGGFKYSQVALASCSSNQTDIESFLRCLNFQFGQAHVSQLEEEVRSNIRKQFHTHNDAIYFAFFSEFYNWLISPEAKSLTNHDIKELFEGWYNNYILLERLCSHTLERIAIIEKMVRSEDTVIDQAYFDRPVELEKLEYFINHDDKKVLILHGESGTGKSTLIYTFYRTQDFIDGRFLFIDLEEIVNFIEQSRQKLAVQHLKALQIVCIDNAEMLIRDEDLKEKALSFIQEIIKAGKKLILVTCSGFLASLANFIEQPCELLELELRSIEEVRRCVPVLNSYLSTSNLPEELNDIMRTPFYLKLIIKHLVTSKSPQLNTQMAQNEFRSLLIRLAIKKTNDSISHSESSAFIRSRKTFLRQLVYSTIDLQKIPNSELVIQSLIRDGIIIKTDFGYTFAHLLYQEWVIESVVLQLLAQHLEAEPSVSSFFSTLERRLPAHSYIIVMILNQNSLLRQCIEKRYSYYFNKYKSDDNYCNLFYIGICGYNEEILKATGLGLYYLSYIKPVQIANFMVFIFSHGIDIERLESKHDLKEKNVTLYIFNILKNLATRQETFEIIAPVLLRLIATHLFDEANTQYLEEFFRRIFCPIGLQPSVSCESRIKFLRANINHDIVQSRHILNILSFVANPIKPSGEDDVYYVRDTILSSHLEEKSYETDALELLINEANKGALKKLARHYLASILEDTLGCVFFRERQGEIFTLDTPIIIIQQVEADDFLLNKIQTLIKQSAVKLIELQSKLRSSINQRDINTEINLIRTQLLAIKGQESTRNSHSILLCKPIEPTRETQLQRAIKENSTLALEMINSLIQDYSIIVFDYLNHQDYLGITALHIAADRASCVNVDEIKQAEYIKILLLLIQNGANPNLMGRGVYKDDTPSHWAKRGSDVALELEIFARKLRYGVPSEEAQEDLIKLLNDKLKSPGLQEACKLLCK